MNIFGIGPLEIVLILIIGILVLGPEGMIQAGRKLGKFMRSVVQSPWWRGLQDGVSEVQNLPYRLMREAELDDLKELEDLRTQLPNQKDLDPWENTSWSGRQAGQPRPEFKKPDKNQTEKPAEGEKPAEEEKNSTGEGNATAEPS